MKITKKIKDLTEEDSMYICNEHDVCIGCPIRFTSKCVCFDDNMVSDLDVSYEKPDTNN